MTEPITPFLEKKLKDLVQPTGRKLEDPLQERHRIYSSALAQITRYYWSGNKYGVSGSYPRNPMTDDWKEVCPYLEGEYRGHNIAALAVDHNGYIIDFDFNHNALFDASTEHAEARLIKRVFSLTQLQDSWNVASEGNPADKYSNALSNVTVYTSLESCTQCTGIMMLGRVKEVVYLQSDQGMYRIGDLLHTITARKEKQDYIRAPEPISASSIGVEIVEDLNKAFAEFMESKDSGPAFHISEDGKERRTSSITSFLCTEPALQAFSKLSALLDIDDLAFPGFQPKCDGDSDECVGTKLTNREVQDEARRFVRYATLKGHRGTPHK